MSALNENDLVNLIKQLETAISQSPSTERDDQQLFERAIWTVENLDKVVRTLTDTKGFIAPQGRVEAKKIEILNSIASEVSTVWETINDGSELEALGEKALILVCNELDRLNALS